MDSEPCTDHTPSKKETRAQPLSDYTCDEGELPPPVLEKVPKRAVNIRRAGEDKSTFKIGSSLGTEV